MASRLAISSIILYPPALKGRIRFALFDLAGL